MQLHILTFIRLTLLMFIIYYNSANIIYYGLFIDELLYIIHLLHWIVCYGVTEFIELWNKNREKSCKSIVRGISKFFIYILHYNFSTVALKSIYLYGVERWILKLFYFLFLFFFSSGYAVPCFSSFIELNVCVKNNKWIKK